MTGSGPLLGEDRPRTVVWFSAGVASAVAAKLTLASTPDAVTDRRRRDRP